jgi:hypothetical protein
MTTFIPRLLGKLASSDHPPGAVIAATPPTGQSPLAVTLNARSSFDVDGQAASYVWDFGDGTAPTGKIVRHTYNSAGDYTATVTDEREWLANGSFEKVDSDGEPFAWTFGNTQAWRVVSTAAMAGTRSLQLQGAYLQQYTPIASCDYDT